MSSTIGSSASFTLDAGASRGRPAQAAGAALQQQQQQQGPLRPGAVGMMTIPRILWEGGYLWKYPYNNTGFPKRRWVQIKAVKPSKGKKGGNPPQPSVYQPLTLIWLDSEKVRSCHQAPFLP
jgi:hypothetical protein